MDLVLANLWPLNPIQTVYSNYYRSRGVSARARGLTPTLVGLCKTAPQQVYTYRGLPGCRTASRGAFLAVYGPRNHYGASGQGWECSAVAVGCERPQTQGLKLSCRLVVPDGRFDLSSAVGNCSAKGTPEVPCATSVACAGGPFSEDGAVTGLRLCGCDCVQRFVPCRGIGLLSRLAK